MIYTIYTIYMIFMKYEDTVLVKIDKETKHKMKKINVNWSEVIRAAIREETGKERNLTKAVSLMYKILSRQKKASKYDSTETIRWWRDHRYGPGSG